MYKKNFIVLIKGTKYRILIEHLFKINRKLFSIFAKLLQISFVLYNGFGKIYLQNAVQEIDRIHDLKLPAVSLQEIRILNSWEPIDIKNDIIIGNKMKNKQLGI